MNYKKVVLVTGASSGIGEATAQTLCDAGWKVYAGARRIDKMEALEAKGVHTMKLDVTTEESMTECVAKILSKEDRIDALVNNAGYGSYGSLEDVPMEEARYQFEVNVFGLARLTQLVLPNMRERKRGKIINVSSIGGKLGEPHGCWYHATKFAVEGLSDSLRMELQQFNIDVVVIQPGAIKTEWGGIARENMLKISGHTVYGNLANKHIAMLEKFDGQGSEPSVIADTILTACMSAKPKTRYAIGNSAGMMLFMKKVLPDRLFDKMMLSYMK
tara:strand:- start:364 stop:1182 length:819 start_codon:yes stop_codon:yes gene_type:complete